MSLYRKIVDDASHIGMEEVALGVFGEPFLDKLLFERIEYAKSKGMRAELVTNATLLLQGNNIASILDSQLDFIEISFDGVTKQTYEQIRVGAKFEEVVNGVRKLIQEREQQNYQKPEIRIVCVVQAANYGEIERNQQGFCELFKGADGFAFSPVLQRGSEGEHIGERLPTELDFRTPTKATRYVYPCRRLFNVINVQADGTVVPCCMDYDGRVKLGDLNTQTIEEVWQSERHTKFRQLHLQGKGRTIELCRDCPDIYHSSFGWWW